MPQANEILNDIKQVLEITSRVDERVKIIQSAQQELSNRMNQFGGEINNLGGRLMVLESKNIGRVQIEDELNTINKRLEKIDFGGTELMKKEHKEMNEESKILAEKVHGFDIRIQTLENQSEGWQSKFKQYSGLVIQAIWVIIVCYILYKLGINSPPTL